MEQHSNFTHVMGKAGSKENDKSVTNRSHSEEKTHQTEKDKHPDTLTGTNVNTVGYEGGTLSAGTTSDGETGDKHTSNEESRKEPNPCNCFCTKKGTTEQDTHKDSTDISTTGSSSSKDPKVKIDEVTKGIIMNKNDEKEGGNANENLPGQNRDDKAVKAVKADIVSPKVGVGHKIYGNKGQIAEKNSKDHALNIEHYNKNRQEIKKDINIPVAGTKDVILLGKKDIERYKMGLLQQFQTNNNVKANTPQGQVKVTGEASKKGGKSAADENHRKQVDHEAKIVDVNGCKHKVGNTVVTSSVENPAPCLSSPLNSHRSSTNLNVFSPSATHPLHAKPGLPTKVEIRDDPNKPNFKLIKKHNFNGKIEIAQNSFSKSLEPKSKGKEGPSPGLLSNISGYFFGKSKAVGSNQDKPKKDNYSIKLKPDFIQQKHYNRKSLQAQEVLRGKEIPVAIQRGSPIRPPSAAGVCPSINTSLKPTQRRVQMSCENCPGCLCEFIAFCTRTS